MIASSTEKKGMVDWRDNHALIIFSPIITKTFKNELLATKIASKIFEKFGKYNKKFTDKIEYNIGVNSGDLISQIEQGKLKYTSMGNTILLAKKISDSSKGKLLVSESIKEKLKRELKSKKSGEIGKSGIYEIEKILDKEADKEKLADILSRMEKQSESDSKNKKHQKKTE
jgi:hypothetical protein